MTGPVPPSTERSVSWPARFVVALAIAALAFEQSPANEAIRVNVAFRTLERTSSEFTVGLVVAGITMLIEGVAAVLVALGIHLNPDLLHRFMGRLGVDVEAAAERETPKRTIASALTDAGIALGIGAALVIVRRRWSEPYRSLGADLRTGAWACLLVAAVSGVIGFLLAGGIRYAEDIGLERAAEFIVDYAADWRFWLVVVVLIQGGPWLVRRLRRGTAVERD